MSHPWRGFRLIPDDVLYFRDGKPSTRGADHYLQSLFPPYPFTLYGALRTRRLIDERGSLAGLGQKSWPDLPTELREEIGEWGEFGHLEIRGPWLVRREGAENPEILLPAPADLALEIEPGDGSERRPEIRRVVRFRLAADPGEGGHSHPLAPCEPWLVENGSPREWRQGPRQPEASREWFLTLRGYAVWRRGEIPTADGFVHRSELWIDEVRTGLGMREGDRVHRDGDLYTFGFIRLQRGIALGFEARNTGLQGGGRLRLGGEGRTCRLEPGPGLGELTDPLAGDRRDGPAEGGGRIRLALATPALSASGAYPPGFAADRLEADLGGRRHRLVSGMLRDFDRVGGWDFVRKGPKPLRRAIPAGTVFIFEPVGEDTARGAGKDAPSLQSDYREQNLALQGFGLAVTGLDF